MIEPARHGRKAWAHASLRLVRLSVCGALLAVCTVLAVEAVVLEPFHVPTGSMAPALKGHHRVGVCPCCGKETVVGRAGADAKGTGEARYYRKAFCQNCGAFPVRFSGGPEIAGDRILVNRAAFLVRAPARWEIVVFRLLGSFYIKRVLGLGGEEILIDDGDVYANGELLRKTFAQARQMALLIFDQEHPAAERWEFAPPAPSPADAIVLDGVQSPCTATYRNYSAAAKKCEPIRDEYAYNGAVHADTECVHDFLIETDIEVGGAKESGAISLRLCDGGEWVDVMLPVGEARAIEAFAWPSEDANQMRKVAESGRPFALRAGRRWHVELALVDRRLSLVVDGQALLCADLPPLKNRAGVERPFQAHADGVRAALHGFRLYRDVHYGQQGANGVHGKVARLMRDQYFLLGDNSPNSEDSRFWPDHGRVRAADLVGSVLFTHGSQEGRGVLRWLP